MKIDKSSGHKSIDCDAFPIMSDVYDMRWRRHLYHIINVRHYRKGITWRTKAPSPCSAFDLIAAFDTVDHWILLELNDLGKTTASLRELGIQWIEIESYLTRRSHAIRAVKMGCLKPISRFQKKTKPKKTKPKTEPTFENNRKNENRYLNRFQKPILIQH